MSPREQHLLRGACYELVRHVSDVDLKLLAGKATKTTAGVTGLGDRNCCFVAYRAPEAD
jgi:hypothetical protein